MMVALVLGQSVPAAEVPSDIVDKGQGSCASNAGAFHDAVDQNYGRAEVTIATLEDVYEPDDEWALASLYEVSVSTGQTHAIHAEVDADWVRFFAVGGTVYDIKAGQLGTNSDLVLEVYYQQADGTLTNVLDEPVDWYGTGTGITEHVALDFKMRPDLAEGFYYVKVTSLAWGEGSDYELRIDLPLGGSSLFVAVFDKLNPGVVPPGVRVVIDGIKTQTLSSTSMRIDIDPGTYTVRVPIVPGYVPEEDPKLPAQVGNTASYLYGNPKMLSVTGEVPSMAVFLFTPIAKAQGTVRDAWTGAWLDGAALEFRALNGCISGLYYRAWPTTNYAPAWVSGMDGAWPTNVWLPAVNWDLSVSRGGYSNVTLRSAISGVTPGAETNLGTVWLTPLDADTNGLADAWEQRYAAGETLTSTGDADGDGANNLGEYLCGTDPTNRLSVLQVRTDGGWADGLAWPVAPGRTYTLSATDRLQPASWSSAGGPWTAAATQEVMRWTDPYGMALTGRYYRVEVMPP